MENKTILYSLHSLQSSEGDVDWTMTQIKQVDYYDAQKKRKMWKNNEIEETYLGSSLRLKPRPKR